MLLTSPTFSFPAIVLIIVIVPAEAPEEAKRHAKIPYFCIKF